MQRRRLVRVPASSANLGPGFDTFAAALALHMELEVIETPGTLAGAPDLAIARDRAGYVRDEDLSFEEFKAQFEGAKED